MKSQIFKSIVNILLSVTFISTFIGAFFFTYGSYVEKNIVKDQSALLAKDIARDVNLFPKETTQKIVDRITIPDMSAVDAQVDAYNKEIRNQAIVTLSVVFIVGLVLSIGISKWKNIDILPLVRDNLIILFFVGIVEFVFLTFVIQNVYIIDPDLRLNLFRKFKSFFQD
jgi:hypothetical protein